MATIQLSAGRIDYDDVGDGPPVVLLHGLHMDGGLWRDVVPLLEAEHRCLVPTLPLGAHRTPMNDGADLTPRGVARLVGEFLDRLGLDDVTLVGADTGGALAQLLLADDGVSCGPAAGPARAGLARAGLAGAGLAGGGKASAGPAPGVALTGPAGAGKAGAGLAGAGPALAGPAGAGPAPSSAAVAAVGPDVAVGGAAADPVVGPDAAAGGAAAAAVGPDVRGAGRVGRLVLVSCEAFENFPPGLPGRVSALAARMPGGLALAAHSMRLPLADRLPLTWGWMAKRPVPRDLLAGWFRPLRTSRAVRRDLAAFVRAIPDTDLTAAAARLGAFHGPALVVWAGDDRVMPPEHASRLAACFADGRYVTVADSYTLVPLDQPAVLARHIARLAPRPTPLIMEKSGF